MDREERTVSMKKRLVSLMLAGLLTLSLTACGGQKSDSPATSGNGDAAPSGTIVLKCGHVLADGSHFDFGVDKFAELVNEKSGFVDPSLIYVSALSVLVFCLFNFRPKGKAKCFAGDVGSISIAYILLFMIGSLIIKTTDVTYLVFLLVYGVDGCLTIIHRILLHENLGQAHRKHAYQLMANELKIGHVKVSLVYMCLQLAVSLAFIYVIPDTVTAHWLYLLAVVVVVALLYVVFMKKYYCLHEEYLASIIKEN